MQNLAEVVV